MVSLFHLYKVQGHVTEVTDVRMNEVKTLTATDELGVTVSLVTPTQSSLYTVKYYSCENVDCLLISSCRSHRNARGLPAD